MADVFLSYAREDIERAQDLAETLEDLGLSVWWDRAIPPGKTFDEVIEAEIAEAACVVVLWSHVSVGSRWVRTEASEAADMGILIPVMVESHVKIPLAFRRIHAADLSEWRGKGHLHAGVDDLAAAIAALSGTEADSAVSGVQAAAASEGRSAISVLPPGARLPNTSMSRVELTLSMVVGMLPIGAAGWLVGPMIEPASPGLWLIRTNVWLFGGLCFASIVVLLEGISTSPTVMGMIARSRQRQLRWAAALSLVAVVAAPLYFYFAVTR